jgi:hypothetical protein
MIDRDEHNLAKAGVLQTSALERERKGIYSTGLALRVMQTFEDRMLRVVRSRGSGRVGA